MAVDESSVAVNVTGVLANVSEYILTVCAFPTMWEIFKARSTKDYSVLPQSMGFLAYLTVFSYGLVTGQFYVWLAAILNGVPYIGFIGIFLFYSPRSAFRTMVLNVSIPVPTGFLIIGLGPLISYCVDPAEFTVFATAYLGVMYVIFCTFQYTAQLAPVLSVLKSKDASCISGWISTGYFLCGGSWALYGIVVNDIYILIPNSIGAIAGLFQMGLVVVLKKERGPASALRPTGVETCEVTDSTLSSSCIIGAEKDRGASRVN